MTTNGIHEVPTGSSGFSRFHAIVSAKPLHGIGPPVIEQRHIPYEPWSVRFHTGKRKRDAPGGSVVSKAVKRDHEGNITREPTKLYHDREELLRSLKRCFSQGSEVDFHGIYELSDSGITHKQRIQTVAHEIWKTTGYRFTVKDHPQVTNGHKTRFWCSQDEAHRSKSSRAARKAQGSCYTPRVTSAGEVMAKARFPCRSRLLISSRDSDKAGMRIITVRMHHHFTHEPYVDSNLPPEVAQGIWESFGWIGQSAVCPNPTLNDDIIDEGREIESSSHNVIHQEAEEGSISSDEDDNSPAAVLDNMDEDPQANSFPAPTGDNNPSGQSTDIYHDRMSAHIKNLREFCDGLEYQLQFNDYRMLNVLEREGGSFLSLVEDCLRKEGRLVIVERPISSLSGTQQDMNSRQDVVDHVPIPSGSHEPPDNPGINPEAFSH
ncbi:hypothetical protein BYT27DRAFT_7220415 [Phlegmacium glaucopus]|nr:hypothetical protein BYT27DRAFT_7220415 [Phlegmacium glaucopus]